MYVWTSLVAQTVKCLSTMRETRVQSLVWEDPLEKEMATHSSTLAWKIPWTEEPGGLQSMGLQRVGHDWATSLSLSCLEKTLESPLDCKEFKSVNLKGNQPWIFIGRTEAEAPILQPPNGKSQLIGKNLDVGKDWRHEKDEMVGWHHWLNRYEFELTSGDGEGQENLVCCSLWSQNESDMT